MVDYHDTLRELVFREYHRVLECFRLFHDLNKRLYLSMEYHLWMVVFLKQWNNPCW